VKNPSIFSTRDGHGGHERHLDAHCFENFAKRVLREAVVEKPSMPPPISYAGFGHTGADRWDLANPAKAARQMIMGVPARFVGALFHVPQKPLWRGRS
jgi:hypothetical protein